MKGFFWYNRTTIVLTYGLKNNKCPLLKMQSDDWNK